MSNTTYNGWTNYATWRVNLEIFDGLTPRDITGRSLPTTSELKEAAKEYAEEMICSPANNGLCQDYAMAFLSDVNWWEIADHLIADYAEEEEESEDA